jgi:hypothetical protein
MAQLGFNARNDDKDVGGRKPGPGLVAPRRGICDLEKLHASNRVWTLKRSRYQFDLTQSLVVSGMPSHKSRPGLSATL